MLTSPSLIAKSPFGLIASAPLLCGFRGQAPRLGLHDGVYRDLIGGPLPGVCACLARTANASPCAKNETHSESRGARDSRSW